MALEPLTMALRLGNADTFGTPLPVRWDAWLILLSLVVLILSSIATEGVAERLRAATRRQAKTLWWIAGTTTVSVGGWAMHFIGVLAANISIDISFDLRLTLLSLFLSYLFLGSYVFFTSHHTSALRWVAAAVLGATGMGGMHFTGMMAMHGVDRLLLMRFEPVLLALAGGLGTLLYFLALRYKAQLSKHSADRVPSSFFHRWIGVLLPASAVATMHHLSMVATTFYESGTAAGYNNMAFSPFVLAVLVALGSFLVSGLVAILTVIDRRLQEAARTARTSRALMVEAIESISDGFCLFDTDDRLVICNQRYRELMDTGEGIEPGMTFQRIIEDLAHQEWVVDAQRRSDGWIAERHERHRNPHGYFVEQWSDERWFQISERRVWNIGTVGITTDITDLKRAELEKRRHLQLEQSYRESAIRRDAALERHRSLNQLVAGVAHEINTPLGVAGTAMSVIDNCLQQLELRFALQAEQKELIADIVESGQLLKKNLHRAHGLVESFKRISVDQLTEIRTVVALPKLIADVVELYKTNANQAKLEIVFEFSALNEIDWIGYPAYLTQVLLNLLQNADRHAYSKKQGGKVRISVLDGCGENNDNLLLAVQDYGDGIPPEVLPHIYDPFFTTGRQGGTGLGLAFVHNIVTSALKGSIGVISEHGSGTTFLISMPRVVPDSDPGEKKPIEVF